MKLQRPGPDAPGGPRVRRNCEVCGEEFWPRKEDVAAGGGRHCSNNCSSKALRRRQPAVCAYCGATFLATKGQKYCRAEHARAAAKAHAQQAKTRTCGCGEQFRVATVTSARMACLKCVHRASTRQVTIGGEAFTVDEIAEATGWTREHVRSLLQPANGGIANLPSLFGRRRAGNPYGPVGRRLSFAGETLPLRQWAKRIGVTATTLSKRLKRGLPIEQVLSPAQSAGKKAPTVAQLR